MKIKTKALIATVITGFLLLVFTVYFGIILENLPKLSAVIILFTIVIFVFLYQYFILRIEVLNKQLNQINSNNPNTTHVSITGNDELTSIAILINNLLDNNQIALFRLKQQLEKKSQELDSTHETMHQITTEVGKNSQTKWVPNPPQNPLTHLPNRAVFNDALNKAMSHAKRHHKICAVLILDLDAFKKIHITLGDDLGNYILNEMSQRLTNTLRTEDLIAHLEGDQFIILLNDIDKPKFASVVAEKLLLACAEPIKEFFLTASIGISIYPNDGVSLEDMLKNADAALYKAKQSGGNKYQFCTHELDTEAREFIRLESDLRNAIEKNQLILYYQPKLNIKKGSIAGVEALLRWAHPELGILSPAQFISIAEDTGLIMKIGEWALREACKTNKFWQNEGYEHLAVALNLSPKQFQHPDIAKTIETILKETELNPKYLELEINEATVMGNIEIAKNRLDAIKAVGIQLSIDHFGAGYTSVSHLKQFPISAIKIDQNYIKGIPNNPDDSAITNAFIGLAHNLGLEVVAEGVETGEQVQYLTLQNCDMIQGYFLSHPLPADKIVLQFKKLMDRALF